MNHVADFGMVGLLQRRMGIGHDEDDSEEDDREAEDREEEDEHEDDGGEAEDGGAGGAGGDVGAQGQLKSILSTARALRRRWARLINMPPEVIPRLDALIKIIESAAAAEQPNPTGA